MPDSVYQAALPFLTATDGQLWLMSTPRGERGFFYNEWVSPDNGSLKLHSDVTGEFRDPAHARNRRGLH